MTENLHEIFGYCPETGVVTWKVNTGKKRLIGRVAGADRGGGYLRVGLYKKSLYIHRVAWAIYTGKWPSKSIDHINGNPSDNRICNLREATQQQNCCNSKMRKNNSTGIKGVSRTVNGKYRATIMMNYKCIHLGSFNSIEGAATAYRAAAESMFGEYQRGPA